MSSILDENMLDPETLSEEQLHLLKRRLGRLTSLAQEGREGVLHIEGEESSEDVPLPASFLTAFARALAAVAEGQAVQLTAANEELTTSEASRLLGVSRPHLVKLLEEGKMPFRKVGSHRRVQRNDVLAYRQHMQQEAEEAFDALTRQAQELSMGYDDPAAGS